MIEAAPTADLVGDAVALQRPGEVVQVRIRAQEDRDGIGSMPAFIDGRFRQGCDGVGFLGHAVRGQHADGTPLATRRLEPLLEPVRVFADQPAGGAQDWAAAAIVLLEPHLRGLGKYGAESAQVGDRRATKLVDTLVVVAHHAKIPVGSCEQLE